MISVTVNSICVSSVSNHLDWGFSHQWAESWKCKSRDGTRPRVSTEYFKPLQGHMLFQSVRCLRTCNTLDSLGPYQYHTCICDVVMHVFNKFAKIQNNSTLTCVIILKNLVYPCIYSNIWILLATLKGMITFSIYIYTYIFTNKIIFLWVKSGRNSLLR